MKSKNKIKWLSEPEEQDYLSVVSYLSLTFNENQAKLFVDKLKKVIVRKFKVKDIFRASSLSLLGISNKHVNRDLKKIQSKISLFPLLLVRNPTFGKVIIADSYHRLCAVYSLYEDALIPCKLIQYD